MSSVVLYVHETDLEEQVDYLAAMTGATVFEKLVPFLTTHIVCSQETQQLRAVLGRMYSQAMAGSTSNKAALTTDNKNVELVTIEWLKSSLLAQKPLPVTNFRPEVVKIS